MGTNNIFYFILGTSLKETAVDCERSHFNCLSEKDLNKDVSTQQISDVNLDDDLYLSDDSVADPDYELPKKCNESNTDSEIEELGTPIITSAQVHVTLPSQGQDESFSIVDSGFEIDRFLTSSPVNSNPSNNDLHSPIDGIAVTNDETLCEVLPDVSENQVPKKRKGRSRKKREECKRLRNSGQSYVTEKGKDIAARQMRALSLCRLKCIERFSELERKLCFDEYWTLGSRDRRAAYIASHITILPKKTQKTDSRTINRDCYCKYTLTINNESRPICKDCFCKTFGETKGFINIVMDKKKHSATGIIPADTRGHQPSKNKKTVDDLKSAKDHILSFPNYESHYCRNRTNKKYLSSDLSIAAMYRLYKESCPNPISLKLYSQCFHDLNLSFKKPAKDTCHTCDLLNTKIALTEGEEKTNFIVELREHQSQAENAYAEKRIDKDEAKRNSNFRAYAFDLQQCLPTPFLKTSVSFYKRQLWSYNLTIHNLRDDKATCYMWDETIGARGANQIASCLWHFLQNLPPEVTEVTFYSDTCGGQNKNNAVAMMFMYLLHVHPTLETINHKFLISGHSHMECDSDHALIERTKKKTQLKINHLNDWMQLIRSCKINNAFTIVPMKLNNFLNFAELSSKKGPFTIKKKDACGEKFLWQPVKWLQYKKPIGEIRFKTNLDNESSFRVINYRKRGKYNLDTIQLEVVSKETLPISKEKKKDLMDLLPLIDPIFHEFYKNIKTDGDVSNIDPDLEFEDPDAEGDGEEFN